MQTPEARAQTERAAEEFWDTETAAAYLHVTPKTLQRWRRAGRIQGFKVGKRILYRPDDIRAQVRPEPNAVRGPKSVNTQ